MPSGTLPRCCSTRSPAPTFEQRLAEKDEALRATGRSSRFRLDVQPEAVGVVEEAVPDRVSHGGIADVVVPLGGRQLAVVSSLRCPVA